MKQNLQKPSLDDRFPKDSAMLLSFINMKLRDDYPRGLEQLADDMDINPDTIISILAEAGFEYNPEANKFW